MHTFGQTISQSMLCEHQCENLHLQSDEVFNPIVAAVKDLQQDLLEAVNQNNAIANLQHGQQQLEQGRDQSEQEQENQQNDLDAMQGDIQVLQGQVEILQNNKNMEV